jgi:hypothetical protein
MRIDNYTNRAFNEKNEFKTTIQQGNGFDLLRINAVRKLIEWKGFPYIFQFIMLFVFIVLIFIGWQVYTPPNVDAKLFAKTNLVTLVIWGIWWPLMIWFAVSFGRVWCMICPLELVSNVTERFSRKLGVGQRTLTKWIRGGAVIVFLYALIQLLVAGISLHRTPAFTSFFLIALLTISAVTGFLFKDRAFCRGFCPIGMLLNAYGRGGMLAVRAGSETACSGCNGKDCIMACNKNKLDARSCPSLLNPPKLNSNKDCLVCGQCIKSCEPDNMQLLLRKPFDIKDAREEKASWSLTIFIMLVSGFVTSELTTEWKEANDIFIAVPEYISSLMGFHSINGFIEGLWTIVIFPLLLWSFFGLITILAKGADSITDAWRRLALPLVIIISAGHLTKAVAKLNSWVGFLPGSLNDPSGQNGLLSFNSGLNVPLSFFSNQIVSVIGILLLIAALVYSIREEKIISGKYFLRILPKLSVFLLYVFIVMGIGLN